MPPNILFILSDQQMATALGCYGNTICHTPHLDRLAESSTRFTNAYCATPICSPARASIQTGLYPHKHGIQSNIYTRGAAIHELPDHPSLLPRRLSSLGYRCGYTGKWHLGFGDNPDSHPEYQNHIRAMPGLARTRFPGALPSTRGYINCDDFPGHGGIGTTTPQFRQYLKDNNLPFTTKSVFNHYPDTFEVTSPPESTVTHFLTENASRWLASALNSPQPFFYMLNYWGPHSPYHAPTHYVDRYRHLSIPPWPSYADPLTNKPTIHNAHRTETTAHWTWAEYETCLKYYYASITHMDDCIGRLLAQLASAGQLDNTLIIFSSDHGDSLGIHRGLTDKSLFMYEETNRIPLIIKPPKSQASTTNANFVGTCDLYSTLLDYAGFDPTSSSDPCDGTSLRPLLEHKPVTWRDCIVTESVGIDFLLYTQRALRFQNHKYVFNAGDTDELYDLAKDPHELTNLAPTHPDLLLTLQRKLEQWLIDHNDGLLERYRRLRHLF